ncbi:DUF4199 family protein [Mucilaginibacter sp. CSA2-8R]|uniref:DUF4199 family protein n=1 Tax=Mucilaginibacter sp. CSA2-8R TaxID=3141542 RepID=UPI00315DD185
MENLDKAVRYQGALRGLLFGGLMLLVDILKLWYLAYSAGSPLVTFIILYPVYYIILFAASLLFINSLRNKIGRYWSLKQAITGIFIMLFITGIIWNNGLNLFSAKIAPVMADTAHVELVEARKKAMESSKLAPEKVNIEVAQMNAAFAASKQFSITNFFRSLLVSTILVFAISAMLGTLFKREKPAQSS